MLACPKTVGNVLWRAVICGLANTLMALEQHAGPNSSVCNDHCRQFIFPTKRNFKWVVVRNAPLALSFYPHKLNYHIHLTNSTCNFFAVDLKRLSVCLSFLCSTTEFTVACNECGTLRDKTIPFASATLIATLISVLLIHEHHMMWKIRSTVRQVCQFR